MASLVHTVTFDSLDPFALATFWADVLDSTTADDDFAGDPEASVASGGVTILFVTVPEAKSVKNRLHLDLYPSDRTRDEEVRRLAERDVPVVADRRNPDGTGWVVMADPEGNEFCVLRSQAERDAAGG
jgi:predicted enzyme related to lactoylglutathione lyase